MGVDYTPQDLIAPLDTNWAEKGRENTRRANAFAAAAKAAIEALQSAVTIKKIKLGSTTYSPDGDGLVTLPSGVVAPAMTTAQRDAITNPTVGQLVENTTTGLTERYTASGWRPIGSYGQPMTTAQRDALISPPNGLIIDNTTLGRSQIRRAGAWADLTPSSSQKVQGAYSGDGTSNRVITVGFTPDLVVVGDAGGNGFGWLHRDSGTSQSLRPTVGGYLGDYLTTNGFSVTGPGGSPNGTLNTSGQSYYWTAFKFI